MPFGWTSDASAGRPPAGSASRADRRLEAAITDFFLPDDARLDDQVRQAMRATLHRLVGGIETDIRRHAARLLAGRGHAEAAAAMLDGDETVLPILVDAGLLRYPELMEELIARTRAELIAEALPVAVGELNRPSLLVRLAELPDSVVAGAAHALLAAENRGGAGTVLPAEVQHRLVWWSAAAIGHGAPADPASDRAVADAAQRCLAAHDEGERPEAVAARLVAAIDPLPAEIAALVVEALGDRRLALVVALLARALGLDADTARALVIEPDDERLWAALRAAGMSREEIARVGLSLADADPRRDLEAFAERLDAIAAMTGDEARAAIAPLSLPRDLRVAARMLARGLS